MDYTLLILVAGNSFIFGVFCGAILMVKKPVKKQDDSNYYQRLDIEV